MKRSRNVGIILLLVVLLTLCLTVFAVLSFSVSRSDYSLTTDQANRTSEYYNACSRAEELLSAIDKTLYDIRKEQLSAPSMEDNSKVVTAGYISDRLNSLTDSDTQMTVKDNSGIFVIEFSVHIDDSQALNVGLRVTDAINTKAAGASTFYEIITWQVE